MQHPFNVSPLPGALYMTPALLSAIHKIQYVINNRQGMALVLGDAGTGKTSLMRRMYSDLAAQEDITVAYVPQAKAKSLFAFVQIISNFFKLPPRASLQKQEKEIQDFTYAEAKEGRNVVLLIDEAQHLDSEMLATLRGFLNFESDNAKFLQIILAGQLDLRGTLKDQKAIRRRIVMSSLLDSLTLSNMRAMLEHRCRIFGLTPFPLDDHALRAVYDATSGVPGEALKLCAVAWEFVQSNDESQIPASLIHSLAAHEGRVFNEAE